MIFSRAVLILLSNWNRLSRAFQLSFVVQSIAIVIQIVNIRWTVSDGNNTTVFLVLLLMQAWLLSNRVTSTVEALRTQNQASMHAPKPRVKLDSSEQLVVSSDDE